MADEKNEKAAVVVVPSIRFIECTYPSRDAKGELKERTIDGNQHTTTLMLPIVDPSTIKTPALLGKAIADTLAMWSDIHNGAECTDTTKEYVMVPVTIDEDSVSTGQRFIPKEIVDPAFSLAECYEAFLAGRIAPIRTTVNQAMRGKFNAEEAESSGVPRSMKKVANTPDAFKAAMEANKLASDKAAKEAADLAAAVKAANK